MNISVVDLVLLAILAYGAWRGYQQGLVVVLINTMALIAAIVVGIKFLDQASNFIATHLKTNALLLPFLAFGLLFGLTFYGLTWFAGYTRKTIRYTLFGSLDQLMGSLFGMFRIAFVLSSILFGLQMIGVEFKNPGNEPLYVFPALVQLGPLTFKVLAPLLPFLSKLLEESHIHTKFSI